MRYFTINEKRYAAKPFNFNTVCNLEDNGVSIQEMTKKPMSMARAYFALCANLDKDKAGEEIEKHVEKGGTFNDLYTAMGEEMSESDFFQALNKKTSEETTTMEMEEKPAKTK